MSRAGLGLSLHDVLYGSDFRPAFDAFWDHAKRNYLSIQDGKVAGSVTMYTTRWFPVTIRSTARPSFGLAQYTACCPCTPTMPACCTTTPSTS